MKHLFPIASLLFIALMCSNCAATRKAKIAEQNKRTIRTWYEEGWNKHNTEALLESTFSPDWFDANPVSGNQPNGGVEGQRRTVEYYRKAFPDLKFNITHLFGDDQFTTVRYEITGTQMGEVFGIPASGNKFTSTAIMVFKMEKGKIKQTWAEIDQLGMINQFKKPRE